MRLRRGGHGRAITGSAINLPHDQIPQLREIEELRLTVRHHEIHPAVELHEMPVDSKRTDRIRRIISLGVYEFAPTDRPQSPAATPTAM